MKNLKTALIALSFIAGLSGALVSKISASPKPTDPIYNWDGGPFNNFIGTVSQAQMHYGCAGVTSVCVTGTLKPGQSGPPTFELYGN